MINTIVSWITGNYWHEGLAVLVGIIALVYILKAEEAYEKFLRLFFVLLGIIVIYFMVVFVHTLS
jgi:hypothetical protein